MQLQTGEPLYQIMMARYYGAGLGRFLSVDPDPGARRLLEPQAWNAYSYCLGNPLKFVDPDGKDIVFAPGQKQGFIDRMTNAIAQGLRNSGAAGEIHTADSATARIVLKEGRLPVTKNTESNTIDIGLGHMDVTGTDSNGNATEITLTIDTTNISNTWASGDRSEHKTDVEVVTHELVHANEQLKPEAKSKSDEAVKAEEKGATAAGEAAGTDEGTTKKPSPEEKATAAKILEPKK